MPQTFCQLARELAIPEDTLTSIIQRAGIPCDTEFNGRFLWLTDELSSYQKNRILLHTGSFGEFPVIGLPNYNLLTYSFSATDLINEFGLNSITFSALKSVYGVYNPDLTYRELYNLAYFLACIWIDIKQEMYKRIHLFWNPLISFDVPVYRRNGTVKPWDAQCNIIRANIFETIDSVYRFLLWSFTDYSIAGRKYKPTIFPMTLASTETIKQMPGVSCLDTPGCRKAAFNTLTTIRSLIAQMCCMLLRRGNDAFVVRYTTEETFADDLKQVYLFIQKMESFINHG